MHTAWYIHVPFCKHACPYCDFYKLELRDRPARTRNEFPALLEREHALLLAAHPELAHRPLDSIYFGGGTPSVLQPGAVAALIASIRARHPDSVPEVTLEANPENLTPARCEAWAAAGITRLSIGVQSFEETDLARLERLHDPATIHRAVAHARAAGIDNLSLDLMFALPGQTREAWHRNLERALALEPQHISFYGLTIHEGTPFYDESRARRLNLPEEDEQADMYLAGSALLRTAGFEHYEISNFALPGFRSRHNQRYWRGDDVLALGPGAHANLGPLRWNNPPEIDGWEQTVHADRLFRTEPEQLDPGTEAEEALFRGIRRVEGFARNDPSPAARRFLEWTESASGREALAQGWVVIDGDRAALTPEGWLRSDAILLHLLR